MRRRSHPGQHLRRPVDLNGWHLYDQQDHQLVLPVERLGLGDTLVVPVHNGFRLGNQGGAITCWTGRP
ncbi:hypothetical protein [Streptomyces sp. NRRL S-1448]|uniref:hypothetical protein n=1 Tax=Streptomyces sp. NRRL S-1448 TaxID=1463883 RepID=UPI00131CFC73|nr:hypothetical protein [Streptomyces sp. NRRL S-1448]